MMKRTRSDEGAILIFALLIITTIAVVTAALLTKGQGNLKTTVQLRSVAGTAYAADAAAQVAITNLQLGGSTTNTTTKLSNLYPDTGWVYDGYLDNTGCFGWNETSTPHTARNSMTLNNLYPKSGSQSAAASATVDCSLVQGSGLFGTGPGTEVNNGNGLGRALTILGTSGSDELSLFAKSGDVLIRGGIASAAKLTTGGLFTNSYVRAKSCANGTPAQVTSTPAVDCAYGGAIDDPNLSTSVSSVPALRTKAGAVQHPGGDSCVFQPGYYDDADALTNATDACGTSTFQPGKYYFDFHNDDVDAMHNDDVMGGSSVWTINNTVIGGTPSGSSVTGQRCVSPLTTTANGVEFVFGGTSRIDLPMNSTLELCGSYSGANPPMALYGLKTGNTAAPTTQATVKPTSAAQIGSLPLFTGGLSNAQLLNRVDTKSDGNVANWTESLGVNSTVNLAVTGYTPTDPIPEGSVLTGATLKITHRTTGTGGATYDVKTKVGATTTTVGTLTKQAAYTDTSIDVTPELAASIHDGTFNTSGAPTFSISKSNLKNISFDVDAITLDLTYIKPALRGQNDTAVSSGTNCVSTPGGCYFVATKINGNPKATFVVQGVTYAPNAAFYLNLANTGDNLIAMKYGLVARSLSGSGWPQYAFGEPMVSIPDTGPGFGSNVTMVDLKVYVCPSSSTCNSSGTPTLIARVKVTDQSNTNPPTTNPAPGARKIEILSWSEQR